MQLPDRLHCDPAKILALKYCQYYSGYLLVKFVRTFFISHLAALRPTLSHVLEGSFTHSMLITAAFQVQPEWDQWDLSQKLSDSECNVLSHCLTLPESVPETIDHLLVSFFSRNCRSFLSILNTFHTLSQYYYSNFKHVYVGWEKLC